MVIAQWIIVGVALVGLIYNTGVVHGVLKNDIEHLEKSVNDLWKEINKIRNYIIEHKDK